MVCAAHTFIAGRMPRRGQDEIFGGHPGMLIPGVPSLRGTCQRSQGGYILNGRWPYASGADHGDWVLVGCKGIRNEAGESCPSLIVVMPKKDAVIDDTWFTLGMRGTGSKDVVLDNVFIPDHYAVPMIEAQLGTVAGRRHPALPAAHPSGAGHHAAGHDRRDGRAGLADLRRPDRGRAATSTPGR